MPFVGERSSLITLDIAAQNLLLCKAVLSQNVLLRLCNILLGI